MREQTIAMNATTYTLRCSLVASSLIQHRHIHRRRGATRQKGYFIGVKRGRTTLWRKENHVGEKGLRRKRMVQEERPWPTSGRGKLRNEVTARKSKLGCANGWEKPRKRTRRENQWAKRRRPATARKLQRIGSLNLLGKESRRTLDTLCTLLSRSYRVFDHAPVPTCFHARPRISISTQRCPSARRANEKGTSSISE